MDCKLRSPYDQEFFSAEFSGLQISRKSRSSDSGYEHSSQDSSSSGHAWYKNQEESSRKSKISQKLRHLVPGRAQLQLSIYKNCGLLTVHIIEAKSLQLQSQSSTTYVKVSLHKDNRSKCKTSARYSQNPRFDEKFSFDVPQEDCHKRLVISVWSKDHHGNRDFIGCMSFGVEKLVNGVSSPSGWYYILTEEAGRKKHLPSMDQTCESDNVLYNDQVPESPLRNAALQYQVLVVDRYRDYKKNYGHL